MRRLTITAEAEVGEGGSLQEATDIVTDERLMEGVIEVAITEPANEASFPEETTTIDVEGTVTDVQAAVLVNGVTAQHVGNNQWLATGVPVRRWMRLRVSPLCTV